MRRGVGFRWVVVFVRVRDGVPELPRRRAPSRLALALGALLVAVAAGAVGWAIGHHSSSATAAGPVLTTVAQGDPGCRKSGHWGRSAYPDHTGTEGWGRSRVTASKTDGDSITWTATLASGTYTVQVWAAMHPSNTRSAHFEVAGTSVPPVDLYPPSQPAGHSGWVSLGTHQLTAGPNAVEVVVQGNGPHHEVRVDAVRFVPA